MDDYMTAKKKPNIVKTRSLTDVRITSMSITGKLTIVQSQI